MTKVTMKVFNVPSIILNVDVITNSVWLNNSVKVTFSCVLQLVFSGQQTLFNSMLALLGIEHAF